MTVSTEDAVTRLAETETVSFGPGSFYNPILLGEEAGLPVRVGIQTADPGYEAGMHSHPYVEVLHILEGAAEVWFEDGEAERTRLEAGDTVTLPAGRRHSFAVVGDERMRLMGIHLSPKRIVDYRDGRSDARGYPVQEG